MQPSYVVRHCADAFQIPEEISLETEFEEGAAIRVHGFPSRLPRALAACSAADTPSRTHLSLHKDAPIPRAVQTVGRTLAMPVLGWTAPPIFRSVSFRQGQGAASKKKPRQGGG